MARVTVEDCIEKIPNRFELVMLAAQRARNLSAGAHLTVDRDDDKNPVVALREIADETIDLGALEVSLVQGLQRHVENDEPNEEELDLLSTGDVVMDDNPPTPDEEIEEDVLSIDDNAPDDAADGDEPRD